MPFALFIFISFQHPLSSSHLHLLSSPTSPLPLRIPLPAEGNLWSASLSSPSRTPTEAVSARIRTTNWKSSREDRRFSWDKKQPRKASTLKLSPGSIRRESGCSPSTRGGLTRAPTQAGRDSTREAGRWSGQKFWGSFTLHVLVGLLPNQVIFRYVTSSVPKTKFESAKATTSHPLMIFLTHAFVRDVFFWYKKKPH